MTTVPTAYDDLAKVAEFLMSAGQHLKLSADAQCRSAGDMLCFASIRINNASQKLAVPAVQPQQQVGYDGIIG